MNLRDADTSNLLKIATVRHEWVQVIVEWWPDITYQLNELEKEHAIVRLEIVPLRSLDGPTKILILARVAITEQGEGLDWGITEEELSE